MISSSVVGGGVTTEGTRPNPWCGDKNLRMWTASVDTGGGVTRGPGASPLTQHWSCHSKQFKTIDPFTKQQDTNYTRHTAR